MEDNRVAIILEDISKKFDLIHEGQVQHTKDIQGIRSDIAKLDHKVHDNTIQILALKHEIKAVGHRLEKMEDKLTIHDRKLAKV